MAGPTIYTILAPVKGTTAVVPDNPSRMVVIISPPWTTWGIPTNVPYARLPMYSYFADAQNIVSSADGYTLAGMKNDHIIVADISDPFQPSPYNVAEATDHHFIAAALSSTGFRLLAVTTNSILVYHLTLSFGSGSGSDDADGRHANTASCTVTRQCIHQTSCGWYDASSMPTRP